MRTKMAAHTHTLFFLCICSIIHGSLATPTHPACCKYVYLFHGAASSAAAPPHSSCLQKASLETLLRPLGTD